MMYGMSAMNYKKQAGLFRAALYCRLSKDDDLQGESASISNQRELLTSVCKANGWDVVEVYQDDGYTGLNMERPGLKRLLADVEQGLFNLVMTKDLSRLGRNYLQTGHLIEDFFPRHGVRYIALNDNIDTMMDSNEIAPFKNILNEMYSRDISKKVHSSYLVSAQKGSFTGTVAPLGYKKDPNQHGHLLIDEETAPIIRTIFDMAVEGHGPNYIRRRLEEQKIPCPAWWNRERGLRKMPLTRWEVADPVNGKYMWDFSVIKDLLINPVYYGAMASQKKNYRFKIGTLSEKKPDEWVLVEGTHDPIIDKTTFDIVQEKLKYRQRPRNNGEFSLFAGLIRCGECGKSLAVRTTHEKFPKQIYACKTYMAFGKCHCTQHRVVMDDLIAIVLDKIRDCAKAAAIDSDEVANRLIEAHKAGERSQAETLKREMAQDEERLTALNKMVQQLYEDRLMQRISDDNFAAMLQKVQQEQGELQARLQAAQQHAQEETQMVIDTKRWTEIIRQYSDIQELDVTTLNRLVKEIIVHEQIDEEKQRHITVEIHFNLQPIPEIECLTSSITA